MSLRIARWHWVRICMLIAAATASWPVLQAPILGTLRCGHCAVIPSESPSSDFACHLEWRRLQLGVGARFGLPRLAGTHGANVCPMAQPEQPGRDFCDRSVVAVVGPTDRRYGWMLRTRGRLDPSRNPHYGPFGRGRFGRASFFVFICLGVAQKGDDAIDLDQSA